MTTSSDAPQGAPFPPPPQQGSASPTTLAMALDAPQLVTDGEMPYLPPAPRPKPAPSAPQVFDAKTLVEATKRKVENPAYGHMPAGTPEGRAAAEAARARMRRRRRRNKVLGWVMAITVVVVIGGAGYVLYSMYEHDQDEQRAEQAASAASAVDGDANGGALTPLGEQAQVIAAQDQLNSGAVASGGAAGRVINDAQQVVDAANGTSGSTQSIALADVLPPEIAAIATELQPVDGLSRYIVTLDDAIRAAPLATPGWLADLQALPQAAEQASGGALLPAVDRGEIAIALQVEGDLVTRLVVLSVDPAIHVEL